MAQRLTAKGVEAWPAGDRRVEVPDAIVPGLYLVVQPTGAKSWAVRYRLDGKPRKFTIGSYPRFELARARDEARAALACAARGIDPAMERDARRREEAETRANTFEAVARDFIERYAKEHQARSWRATEATFERDLFPIWGKRPFSSIRRRDLHALLDAMQAAGRPGSKHHVVAAVSKLFNWAVDREIIEASPFARMKRPAVGKRFRVLSDAEIVELWGATGTPGYPFGHYVRLLLLTGCRRTELSQLALTEVDQENAAIVLSPDRHKTKQGHLVPLSPLAERVLKLALPKTEGPFVFSTNCGQTPITGFSKLKERLDKSLSFDWDLHDLRRTVRTGLSRLRVSEHVAERVLGHVPQGVKTHYDLWSYADEKREALNAWGQMVQSLVEPLSNVVPLRGSH